MSIYDDDELKEIVPSTFPLRVDVTANDYYAFKALTNEHYGLQAEILRKAVKWAIKELREAKLLRQQMTERIDRGLAEKKGERL